MQCVNVPNETGDGTRIDCHDRESIERACMGEGTRRFSQTSATLLMHKDFIERVGYHAKLPGTEEILQGNFIPPDNMDKYAVQFLSQLKKKCNQVYKIKSLQKQSPPNHGKPAGKK